MDKILRFTDILIIIVSRVYRADRVSGPSMYWLLPTHAVIQYRCRELFGKLHRRLPVAQNSLVDPIDTFKLLVDSQVSGIVRRPAGEWV